MAVNIIVDLVLALVIIGGVIVGIKMGFVKTVAKPAKLILAIVLALSLANAVGNAIVAPIVSEPISNKLESVLLETCAGLTSDNVSAQIPPLVKFAAGACGVSVDSVATGSTTEEIVHSITVSLTEPVVAIISAVIAAILLYIVSKLLLSLVFAIIDKAVNRGLVGKINKILGCVCGLFFALLACWGLSAVFDFVIHLPVLHDAAWVQQFSGGFIYNFFKNVSPLEILLSF
ncbi:MAG: CvpA family protein [Clostridia bacterium]|nr:CvpA family protein [Clostridia bacterium]